MCWRRISRTGASIVDADARTLFDGMAHDLSGDGIIPVGGMSLRCEDSRCVYGDEAFSVRLRIYSTFHQLRVSACAFCGRAIADNIFIESGNQDRDRIRRR